MAESDDGECKSSDSINLRDFPLSSDQEDGSVVQSSDCAICLQPHNLPVEIPCGHSYCFLCIKGVCARNSRCPLCRKLVPADYFYEPKILSKELALSPIKSSRVLSTAEESTKDDGATCSTDTVECQSASKSQGSPSAIWYYEGRNGWWRYDDRTLLFIEEAYSKDPTASSVDVTISGYGYVIDFRRMIQFRKDEPSRRRRVKRDILDDIDDTVNASVKGIAGIKLSNPV